LKIFCLNILFFTSKEVKRTKGTDVEVKITPPSFGQEKL